MTEIFHNEALRTLKLALDGLSMRQQVIGHNIANIDTPNFKAGEVRFEDMLQQAVARGGSADLPLRTSAPGHFDGSIFSFQQAPELVQLEGMARSDGNTVDVDQQMSRLAETQIAYSAASRLVSEKLGLLRTIVNDGRR